jgi:hypothetical protein
MAVGSMPAYKDGGTDSRTIDQPQRFAMNALSDFFTLRPVFTFFGLQIVWYIYLLHMAWQLYVSVAEVSQLLVQRGMSWLTWSPNFLPVLLALVAQIALVRLILEVAATILLAPRRSQS